jgi:hypothetical protein
MPHELNQLRLPNNLMKLVENRIRGLLEDGKTDTSLSIKRLRSNEEQTSMTDLDSSIVSALPHALDEFATRLAWSQYVSSSSLA